MHVESGLEKNHGLGLLARSDLLELHEQVPAKYLDADGEVATHWFDFVALLKDGSKVAVAVRPADKAESLRAELELVAASVSRDFADRIAIMTENDLSRELIHDAKLIQCVRRDPPCESDPIVAELVAVLEKPVAIKTLVEESGRGALAFRAVVRLIGAGVLEVFGPGRIDEPTLVAKPAAIELRRAA
jgi:hypothetical protein